MEPCFLNVSQATNKREDASQFISGYVEKRKMLHTDFLKDTPGTSAESGLRLLGGSSINLRKELFVY